MKRALMYASVASMIQQFNMENIRLLLSQGYQVDVACNMEQGSSISAERIAAMKAELEAMGVRTYHIPVPRKISAVTEIARSLCQTRKLINDRQYMLIHCHSPIGGLVCRVANRLARNYKSRKMIYTAHGFHFFRGNHPLKNIVFRTIESFAARFTDILIAINQEDFAAAEKFHLKNGGRVEYVPGVGIDLGRIAGFASKREELCALLDIPIKSRLILSVGELNDNKNHRTVVEVFNQLPAGYHYLICGQGANREALERLAEENGCGNRLHILGYRDDVISIMKSCDVYVFPSKREGLSVALMEAMACGLPCFASDIRGNSDLLENAGGALIKLESFGKELVEHLCAIDDFPAYQDECAQKNTQQVKRFARDAVEQKMAAIYM